MTNFLLTFTVVFGGTAFAVGLGVLAIELVTWALEKELDCD